MNETKLSVEVDWAEEKSGAGENEKEEREKYRHTEIENRKRNTFVLIGISLLIYTIFSKHHRFAGIF